MTFSPANNASPSSSTALITWVCRWVPNNFNANRLRIAWVAGTICGAGQVALADHAIERHRCQRRQGTRTSRRTWCEYVLGSRLRARASAGSAAVGLVPAGRSSSFRLGNLANPSCFEHCGHGRRGSPDAFLLEGLADIIDGLVLLAESNDLLLYGFRRLGPWTRCFGEELPRGIVAELMCQLMQAAHGIAESCGDFRSRNPIDEIGPQGFVLPMRGVLRSQKDLRQIH